MMINALSFDLEEWFCTLNLRKSIQYIKWNQYESRIENNTYRLLEILKTYNTHATFFVLGWIANKHPGLIKEIEHNGHEIATHGYSHTPITEMNCKEFEADFVRGLEALYKSNISQSVIGYRAPSFSIVKSTLWVFEILENYGIKYDASIFPFGLHPNYGIRNANICPYKITENFYEFPLGIAKIFGIRIPCAGGGYFRFLPYKITEQLISRSNKENRPILFYLHPWEIDPTQPRINNVSILKKFKHYNNLHCTERRFHKLLQNFKFSSIKNVLGLEK